MTLGASPNGTFHQGAASFHDLSPAERSRAGGHQPSKSVLEPDERRRPAISPRHRNSDFEHYISRHRSPAVNAVPLPFKVNEDGRSKKTAVEDHIIQRKKVRREKIEQMKADAREKNEEVFIKYLLAKKAEIARTKRLARE